jgi:predicted nucleic acid-binding protein
MIILDTNVVSALMRPEMNTRVIQWVDTKPSSNLWITAITLLEIRSGLLFMPDGKRKEALVAGFGKLLSGLLAGRVLPFDGPSAEYASQVDLLQHRRGNNIGIGDIQIAGIALAQSATLATRNVKDFDELDIPLVDPWTD